MMKYEEFIGENLANELSSQPKSNAAKQAKQMNLTYIGFGRYSDAKGKMTYIVKNDRLYPVKSKEELDTGWSNVADKALSGNMQPKDAVAMQQVQQMSSIKNYANKKVVSNTKKVAGQTQVRAQALSELYSHAQFNDDQLDAIKLYTSDGFEDINRFLYKGFDEGIDLQQAQMITNVVDNLDSIFAGNEAPYPYPTYVGLNERYDPNKLKVGSTYVFRGYISTSIDPVRVASSFDGTAGAILQIDLQEGQPSVYIDDFSSSPGEMETLLPRGTTVTVVEGPLPFSPSTLNAQDENASNMLQVFRCTINQ